MPITRTGQLAEVGAFHRQLGCVRRWFSWGKWMGQILRLAEIPLDTPLSDSLYDGNGVLLVRQGSMVTSNQLKDLARRGLQFLELGAPLDVEPLDESPAVVIPEMGPGLAPRGTESDRRDDGRLEEAAHPSPPPTTDWVEMCRRPLDPAITDRVEALVTQAAKMVEELGQALANGTLRDAAPIRDVANQFRKELLGDPDQTLTAALRQTQDQELAVRSVQMSVLSMAIAGAMNLIERDTMVLGTAALIHDMALFSLPEPQRYSRTATRPEARRVYESHPGIAYDMLERVRDVDGTVRIVVLQTHEQADGSGFPRRITTPRIHRLARVTNVADAYLTLVGCGFGGQKLFPADAIAYLMHHACAGHFNPDATSGLVRAVSIYPVGSLVRLSDDRVARVARLQPERLTQPVVQPIGGGELIRLNDRNPIAIVSPLDDEDLLRHRLPAGEIEKVLW